MRKSEEQKKWIPEELKKIIKEQYEIWKNYKNKYLSHKDWNEKYILKKSNNEKVHVRSIFSMLQNLYSIFVIDERKVNFFATEIAGEEITRAYNKLAEFDYKKMNKLNFDFLKVYNWFIYGIWATRISWWDKENDVPILENVSALSLILDPDEIKKWQKRRFIWVNKKISLKKLKQEKWYFDLWQITKQEEKLKEINIYHHYTKYEDKVYLTTWLWEDCSRLIKVSVFSKKSGLWDSFWFSLFIPWNIWNWQLWDLIELWADYQVMLNQITNLMLIQAKKDVLWEDRLVNINKVDIEFLWVWTPWWRNIPVELEEWENLSNVLMQIPKEQSSQKSGEAIQILEKLKQEATGISPITQWMVSDNNMTKWEVQTLQANANMKFSLILNSLLKSDVEFWLTWQAFYRQYFDGTKNIFLDNNHKIEYLQITRKDLWNDFVAWAVNIESKSEINKKRKEKHQNMLAIMPNAIPMMSEENQKSFTRKIMELSGLEKEEALSYIPESADEIQAKIDLERLNKWMDASEPKLWQNHEVFEKIFSLAVPSEKVAKAIAERRMLKINEAQNQNQEMPQEQWNFNNMQNISQAQTMSKILNNDNKWNLITNENILW